MNKVILMGRLTRDPDVRYSQGENPMAVARYSIAVDRRVKREGRPDADFINCVSFGKQGEFVEKYLRKGTKVVVEGELQNDNYTNKDGNMVYGMQVAVSNVEFAESKKASDENAGGVGSFGAGAGNAAPSDGFINIPDSVDDELPFE